MSIETPSSNEGARFAKAAAFAEKYQREIFPLSEELENISAFEREALAQHSQKVDKALKEFYSQYTSEELLEIAAELKSAVDERANVSKSDDPTTDFAIYEHLQEYLDNQGF